MDSKYNHLEQEQKIYQMWESLDAFSPEGACALREKYGIKGNNRPFTILLPPPNASGKMHTGNVLMIAIEDLIIRRKRQQGYDSLWVPGTDHAGFETQTTFEKVLKKKGKSRFDFDRETLYGMIHEFVMSNKSLIEDQIKSMGASVDWSRYIFTLDPKAIDIVTSTFEKMEKEGLVYRAGYVVNYSFKWGTAFSDAEVEHKENITDLYYIKYKLVNRKEGEPEFIAVATVRPEPIYVDTHLAVNPRDKKHSYLVGRKVLNPLTGKEMHIIADTFVDPKFGTGVVKLTPAHDKKDFEVAKKHNLPVINLINLDGTLNELAGDLAGLTILEGRKKVVEILEKKGLIEKIDKNYKNLLPVDYRSNDYVENLVLPNWFIKVGDLKDPALKSVTHGDVTIYPKWRKVTYTRWVENMYDWAISRQVTWGIRIPAWYNVEENPDILVTFISQGKNYTGKIKDILEKHSFGDVENGLQSLVAPEKSKYIVSKEKPGDLFLQETDTFDTWFSSGQWPLVTLGYPESTDFKKYYPIQVMETGWEIITRWVSRMMMFGFYATDKPPFKDIYLHGMVRAIDGRKMSKSFGNVINPDEYIEEYGVDALRMGLIAGTANGKDFNFPKEKVFAYRNFANKLWNMARFTQIMEERFKEEGGAILDFKDVRPIKKEDKEIVSKLSTAILFVNKDLGKYRFAQAGEAIYHFIWEDLASSYIEHVKQREDKEVALSVLLYVYKQSLKLLHPFMPFVTEAIWQEIKEEDEPPLIISSWPTAK